MSRLVKKEITLLQYILAIHRHPVRTSILTLPAELSKTAGTDGWISIIIGSVLTTIVSLCIGSGRALRHACAEVRRIFLQQAAERLGVDIDALDVEDGTISGPGNVRTSYWELAEEVSLDRDATPDARPKTATRRALAGNSIQRIDIPDKVFAPAAIHPRSGAAGNAARPRAAAGECARETHRIEGGWRPRGCRSRRDRARRQFCRRRQRDRAWRGTGRFKPCARARPGPMARRCPTKTIWLHS